MSNKRPFSKLNADAIAKDYNSGKFTVPKLFSESKDGYLRFTNSTGVKAFYSKKKSAEESFKELADGFTNEYYAIANAQGGGEPDLNVKRTYVYYNPENIPLSIELRPYSIALLYFRDPNGNMVHVNMFGNVDIVIQALITIGAGGGYGLDYDTVYNNIEKQLNEMKENYDPNLLWWQNTTGEPEYTAAAMDRFREYREGVNLSQGRKTSEKKAAPTVDFDWLVYANSIGALKKENVQRYNTEKGVVVDKKKRAKTLLGKITGMASDKSLSIKSFSQDNKTTYVKTPASTSKSRNVYFTIPGTNKKATIDKNNNESLRSFAEEYARQAQKPEYRDQVIQNYTNASGSALFAQTPQQQPVQPAQPVQSQFQQQYQAPPPQPTQPAQSLGGYATVQQPQQPQGFVQQVGQVNPTSPTSYQQ